MRSATEVVMVSGLPGSGKSYFASRLAERTGAAYLNSDRIRKEIFEKPAYSNEEKERVYGEMENRLRAALSAGRRVVLDATFYREELRRRFRDLAASSGCPFAFILVTASEATIKARVSRPREDSDADWPVYLKIKGQFEPITGDHLVLSSETDIELMLEQAVEYLREN